MTELAGCLLCAAGVILFGILMFGREVARQYRTGELVDTEWNDGAF